MISHFTWVKHQAYPVLGFDSFCSEVTEVPGQEQGEKIDLPERRWLCSSTEFQLAFLGQIILFWNLLFRNTTISLLTADNCMVSIDPTMPTNTERWALLPPAPPKQAQDQGQGRWLPAEAFCVQREVSSSPEGGEGSKKCVVACKSVLVGKIFTC